MEFTEAPNIGYLFENCETRKKLERGIYVLSVTTSNFDNSLLKMSKLRIDILGVAENILSKQIPEAFEPIGYVIIQPSTEGKLW